MSELLLAPIGTAGAAWDQAAPVPAVTLTAVQMRILRFISHYQQLWGEIPTYREIAEAAGLARVSSVGYQIHRMQALGVLRKPAKFPRAIQIQAVPVRLA